MDLSIIIADWPYDEEEEANNVRKIVGVDGRMKVQLRVHGGVLQWDVDGRPDGRKPYGCRSVLDYCAGLVGQRRRGVTLPDHECRLDSEQVEELVTELYDYCRRSRALFLLGDYCCALKDSLHSLRILRLVREYSPPATLVFRYDRYRPSLLVDRSRAEMLYHIQAGDMRKALDALNRGVRDIESFYAEYEMEDQTADSSERQILVDLRRSLREKYNIPLNDRELLHALTVEQEIAVRKENYEMAARLRDKINLLRQKIGGHG
jgi:hypothetical protein